MNPNRDRGRTMMRLAPALWLGAAVAALLTSCIVFRGRSGDSIRFPLAPHSQSFDDCTTCHEQIDSPQVDSATRRAVEASCFRCHESRKEDCTWCHADPASAGVFPDKNRQLTFSHEKHLKRTKGDCSRCHAVPHGETTAAPAADGANAAAHAADAAADIASPADRALPAEHPTGMPGHAECFSCHQMQEFYDKLECLTCHRALMRYGLKPYEEFTHTVDFVRREHADLARSPANLALCSQCHEESFCNECHANRPLLRPIERHPERVFADYIHKGDYDFVHPWEARVDPGQCLRCHGRSFCEDCHESRGISERGAAEAKKGFHFHGPGVLVRGSPDFHGTAARRDIVACAACHDDGARANCITCHAVGAFGGNPHPPGFRSRLSRTGAPVCRLCHDH